MGKRSTEDEQFLREARDLIVAGGLDFISSLMSRDPAVSGAAHAILMLADWEVGDAVAAHLADWEA